MIPQLKHTEVLIVGAGPSGLMMAAQLLRLGVQPLIIDKKEGPTDKSKALAVQARSLEIYRQMGVIDDVLKAGKPGKGLQLNRNTERLATFPFTDTGKDETAYPYILMYPQSSNERVLLNYLTARACPVYWNTSLIELHQNSTGVTVTLQNGEDKSTLTCNWLVGADGAHSNVRKQLQVPFTGDTYPRLFYLIDAKLNRSGDHVDIHMAGTGFCALFPMPEEREWRIIGNVPDELKYRETIRLEDVLPEIKQTVSADLAIESCKWFTTYKLHHRMAEKFRLHRCFLIGDAAHIHSPVGGQGMNTGLQDAYNLAWKLAGVIKNEIGATVLDSYADERMPVARNLLRTTDRAFNIVMSGNLLARALKTWVMPRVLKLLWGRHNMRNEFFLQVSQLGINYRHSKINLHLSHHTTVKAGDRLPYLKIYDEKQEQETDMHAWCNKPGFTLIVLGRLSELDLFTIAKWLSQTYRASVNFFYLPRSSKNETVFQHFDIKPNYKKAIIVRPDMYIGFMNDVVDMEMMDNYLRNTVGLNPSLT